jgi:hypothetical protein
MRACRVLATAPSRDGVRKLLAERGGSPPADPPAELATVNFESPRRPSEPAHAAAELDPEQPGGACIENRYRPCSPAAQRSVPPGNHGQPPSGAIATARTGAIGCRARISAHVRHGTHAGCPRESRRSRSAARPRNSLRNVNKWQTTCLKRGRGGLLACKRLVCLSNRQSRDNRCQLIG